jgi:DNA-binding GntR family transcriptional regulator
MGLSPWTASPRRRQHLGILDPLIHGDLAEAEDRLVGHFDESLAIVEERTAVALTRMLGRGPR